LERLCPFERKRSGTIVVFLFFGVVFAPVLRPATLIEPEAIAETAPIGEPFLFARQQIAIRASQEKIIPA
jgi:hypothetical protein